MRTGPGDVLGGDIRLRAVRGDADADDAQVAGAPEILYPSDPGNNRVVSLAFRTTSAAASIHSQSV